ncbi:uncharacterized protein LOC141760793 [Sebastes fasciatus]|uniref:uncharacterized protein LOC141760793 n=1 Tax=Sebastes fasciatus TaxID=394691 RepID=UPI003D9E360D
MRSFTLTALLLCSLSSVSGFESQTVEVQSGDEVTLTCTNITSGPGQTEWFRLINRTKPSCISSKYKSDDEAAYCVGFKKGFEMSSNNSTVFLKIKRLDLSDSGLYFCGFYVDKHTVIGDATLLIVQEECDVMSTLMSLILGGLTVSLTIVVVVLAVKVRKLQTGTADLQFNLGSDELNSAALSFLPETIRNRRPASEREVETRVVYAASR